MQARASKIPVHKSSTMSANAQPALSKSRAENRENEDPMPNAKPLQKVHPSHPSHLSQPSTSSSKPADRKPPKKAQIPKPTVLSPSYTFPLPLEAKDPFSALAEIPRTPLVPKTVPKGMATPGSPLPQEVKDEPERKALQRALFLEEVELSEGRVLFDEAGELEAEKLEQITMALHSSLDLMSEGVVSEEAAKRSMVKGEVVVKYGRRGRPHKRLVFVGEDMDSVRWRVRGRLRSVTLQEEKGGKDRVMPLSEITAVVRGCKTKVFSRYKMRGEEMFCLSLIGLTRTLDVKYSSLEDREAWFLRFEELLKK